jgi:hypothetical protein
VEAQLETRIKLPKLTTSQRAIKIPGCEVVPVPLFNALDGKNSRDYIARVEPSSHGGRKMAEYILDIIHSSTAYGSIPSPSMQAPLDPQFMAER